MENNDFTNKIFQETLKPEQLSCAPKPRILKGVSKYLRKFIFIGGVAGIGLFVNSCSMGYVASEPAYVEYSRPARPSNLHIWIDGDWVYNRHSRAYVRNTGYWQKPSQNSIYVSGRWQKGTKGQYWERGKWQRNRSRLNRNNR